MEIQPQGWIEDPAEVDAATVAMGGDDILFGNSPLKGYAQRCIDAGITHRFSFEAEKALFGKYKPAFHQQRGTCVDQGTSRAIIDSWYSQLYYKGQVGRKVDIVVATLYGHGRVHIGRGKIRGDGCVGAWAAMAAHKFGVLKRGVYGKYDLSTYNGSENYAVLWGDTGVPQEITALCSEVEIDCYRCMTGMDMADALFADYCIAFCGKHTGSSKNNQGFARLNADANHCTESIGVCLDKNDNILIGGQQSWGQNLPRGGNRLVYKDGQIEMRNGMWFSPIEDYERELRSSGGEAWAFKVSHGKGFR